MAFARVPLDLQGTPIGFAQIHDDGYIVLTTSDPIAKTVLEGIERGYVMGISITLVTEPAVEARVEAVETKIDVPVDDEITEDVLKGYREHPQHVIQHYPLPYGASRNRGYRY
jgi:hypothetical protein